MKQLLFCLSYRIIISSKAKVKQQIFKCRYFTKLRSVMRNRFQHLFKVQGKGNTINFNQLTEINEEDLPMLYSDAKSYLLSHKWCKQVRKGWQDENFSILDKLGVFLFEIEPIIVTVDEYIWVIFGDLPSVYLDTRIKTGRDALETYCELMNEWTDSVLHSHSLDEVYPVEAKPTRENAELLKKRVAFIKRELLMEAED